MSDGKCRVCGKLSLMAYRLGMAHCFDCHSAFNALRQPAKVDRSVKDAAEAFIAREDDKEFQRLRQEARKAA